MLVTLSGGPFLNARGHQCDPLFAEFKRLLLPVLATRTLHSPSIRENASVTTDSPARSDRTQICELRVFTQDTEHGHDQPSTRSHDCTVSFLVDLLLGPS